MEIKDLRLTFDDGSKEDMKILELLRKHNLTRYATFYIPSNCLLEADEILDIAEHCQIGGHTTTHALLTRVPLNQAEQEIKENKAELEELIGKDLTSFCYPRGYYNPEIIDLVKEAGYLEARTTKVLATEKGLDNYQLPTTVHVYPRKEYNGESWLAIAGALLNKNYFHLWGHGWEISKLNEWDNFDYFLGVLSESLDTQRP